MNESLREVGQHVAHARQAGFDLARRDRTGAEPEPPRLLRQAEGLEGDDGESGVIEEKAADLFVRGYGSSADEVELYGEVDRSLRRDGADRQPFAAHGVDAVVEKVEPELQLADHRLVEFVDRRAHAEKVRD